MKRLLYTLVVLLVAILSRPTSLNAQTPSDTVSGLTLDSATVSATRLLFVTKKDTVVYNLDAAVQQVGEMLQDVLNRLPGLELRDGALYFRGKKVERVLVNGSDFIQGDTKTLLQNLPAYMVKHVRAYERKSDFTLRTGIDDGTREQTIDVELKRKYLGAWNINALVAGGTDNHWRLRGFAMNFTERASLTAWGAGNNVADAENGADNGNYNTQQAGLNSGRHTAFRKAGVHGMWGNAIQPGHKGHFKAWAQVGLDNHHPAGLSLGAEETFYTSGALWKITRLHTCSSTNTISGWSKVEYNILDNTWLEFQPSFTRSIGYRRSRDEAATWTQNPYGASADASLTGMHAVWPLDTILYYTTRGTTPVGASPQWLSTAGSDDDRSSWFYTHTFHFSHRFSPAIEFDLYNTLRHSTSHNDYRCTSMSYYYDDTLLPDVLTPVGTSVGGMRTGMMDYTRPADSRELSHETSLNIYWQVARLINLRALYAIGGNNHRSDAEAYRYDRDAADPDNTEHLSHSSLPQKAEIGGHYNDGKHLFASFSASGTFTRERYDYARGAGYEPWHQRRHTKEYAARIFARIITDSIGQFVLTYRYTTSAPDISKLVTLPDRTSPYYLRLGNPNLRNGDEHWVKLEYGKKTKGMVWYNLGVNYKALGRSVITASSYDPATGITTTQPMNADGVWQGIAVAMLGLPLDRAKRFNAMFYVSYEVAHDVGRQDSRYTVTTRSPFFSFRMSYRRGKTDVQMDSKLRFSMRSSDNAAVDGLNNRSWTSTIKFRTTLPLGIEVSTDFCIDWQHINKGLDYEPTHCLWNASLQRSFLRDKNLTLSLSATDILGQLHQGGPYATATSRGYHYTETVRRYLMFSLLFRFNTKK
ncbi:MAG: outer membrane beta-barrel protein [Bacteroidaceae bacterium]|nr:outer membrane beta-barrel protein [Bacteroidaceae bacterium]